MSIFYTIHELFKDNFLSKVSPVINLDKVLNFGLKTLFLLVKCDPFHSIFTKDQ